MRSARVGTGVAVVAALAAACLASPTVARLSAVGCSQSVYGPLDHWRSARSSVLAGPAGWPYLRRSLGGPAYGPHKGLAVFVKGLFVVERRHTVRIRIPRDERERLSLYYGKAFEPRTQWHGETWFRVSDGAAAVTFTACRSGSGRGGSQFAGGFLVRGSQCAVVEVRLRGSARWLRRRLAFGKGTCG
jgi:hypothetical protein